MSQSIKLNQEEQVLYDSLRNLVSESRAFCRDKSTDYEAQMERNSVMREKAHELHMMLKADGNEPRHHRYMYKNRGVSADKVEFYDHIHPVEDLLSFINDPDSTKDSEDTTINERFLFKVYTRRWGHYDNYTLTRTKDGWQISGGIPLGSNEADKAGNPSIFAVLDQDFVSYPRDAGKYLERVWQKAAYGATKKEIQADIANIAEWISLCEKNTPQGLEGVS